MIDQLAAEAARGGPFLAVIDPLAPLLPGPDENNAVIMLTGLAPLQRLTAAGATVLILHHPRKADGMPRGSGALPGVADILMELGGPQPGAGDDRRRSLRAVGRFPGGPIDVRIELNAAGTDYTVLPAVDPGAEAFTAGWPVLRQVLEDARERLTRQQILAEWPEDHPAPGLTQLWAWLDRAVAAGLVERTGAGRKREPFRYGLPSRADEPGEGTTMRDERPPLDECVVRRRAQAAVRARDGLV
jgi:hypothetical protein